MNDTTKFLLQFYHFTLLIRDSLFYAFHRKEYKLDAYRNRQTQIKKYLEHPVILPKVLEHYQENGQKILERTKQFYELFYGEKSQAFSVQGAAVVFKEGFNHILFEMVVSLHDIYLDILGHYLLAPSLQTQIEMPLFEIVESDKRFFKGMVLLGLLNEMEMHFSHLKKVLKEDANAESERSRTLQKRLGFYSTFIIDLKSRNTLQDPKLNALYAQAEDLVMIIRGKKATPLKPGPHTNAEGKPTGVVIDGQLHQFLNEVFAACRASILDYKNESERHWLTLFETLQKKDAESPTAAA